MLVTLRGSRVKAGGERKDPRNKAGSFIPVKGSNYNFQQDVWFEIFWFESNLRIMFVSVSQRFIT